MLSKYTAYQVLRVATGNTIEDTVMEAIVSGLREYARLLTRLLALSEKGVQPSALAELASNLQYILRDMHPLLREKGISLPSRLWTCTVQVTGTALPAAEYRKIVRECFEIVRGVIENLSVEGRVSPEES